MSFITFKNNPPPTTLLHTTLKQSLKLSMKKIAIIGLGNPGEKYQQNRHNAGFLILDYFLNQNENSSNNSPAPCGRGLRGGVAENWGKNTKLEAKIAEVSHSLQEGVVGEGYGKIILAKPNTFMNNSGRAVSKIMDYFDIPKEDILVIQDDLDLPFGSIRFSKDSGSAGHKGIKSIIESLGTQDFSRLRVGIANEIYTQQNIPSEKFVLENFNKKEEEFLDPEKKELAKLSEKISEAVCFFVENGFEETKNKYNKSAMPLIELK